ncbi:GNAT family N-acetyltransferase, partial [Nocardia abscessus]|uniref:GNAT family N-acetyltransferase n=1 Tax=Nocardia abscessus TaxID=120957 RepID=UPI0024566094
CAPFPGLRLGMEPPIAGYVFFFRAGWAGLLAGRFAAAAGAAIRRAPTAGDFRDQRRPSHLHINVAPQARGTGAADRLMVRWFERLAQAGSPGCHLQTLVENVRAVRFFERMGFTAHGTEPLVPGLRYRGRRVHQRTMVRDS